MENACVGGAFGFVFTVVVAGEITLNGTTVALDSIIVNDVSGLPAGMTYSCSNADCSFAAGTLGCATVWGVPQETGDFDLTITGTIYGPFFPLGQTLTFPNPILAPGTYTLTVLEEGSMDCTVLDNDEVSKEAFEMILSPNPVSDFAQITVISNETTAAKMVVRDLTGKAVVNNNINLVNGDNNINFSVSTLPNGIYLYSIENGDKRVTKKMIVQK